MAAAWASRLVEMVTGSSVDKDLPTPEVIARIQEKFLQNPPLELTAELHMVRDKDGGQFSPDQLLQLSGQLSGDFFNITERTVEEGFLTHVILVVDRSGSMQGNPFSQVKTALEEIMKQSVDDPNRIVDIVLYNTKAERLNFTAENYRQVISELKATDQTNFKAAFNEVVNVMNLRQEEKLDQTTILFMTDGQDSCNPSNRVNECAKKWAKTLKQSPQPVTVHTIGFSKDHEFQFLKRLCGAGTEEGLFRYCEPSDGPEALKDKLEELFDFVNSSDSLPLQFEVALASPEDRLVPQNSQSGTLDGSREYINEEKGLAGGIVVSVDCWLHVFDPSVLPKLSIGLQMILSMKRVKYTLQIPCIMKDIQRVVKERPSELVVWELRVLSRNADILTSELSSAIIESKDVMSLKSRLDKLAMELSGKKVFSSDFNKQTRAFVMESIKEIQSKVDRMHAMLAQYLRGEANSVSLLARAHDLRYEAKFSKSRRDRLMNRRVAQNFNSTKQASQKAKVFKDADLAGLSQEALDFYVCILSMCSVKEILTDNSDLENALGIGLAVSRPEHVIDDPTSIRIFSISASLVSRSSVMDALEFKIDLEGQLSAHGGFSFNSIGYATVGAGREPINAWLPLYISDEHWERVKTCLRPSLGYFCTLDPLGYSESQLDILFMVLGSMIGQLYQGEIGENQLKLIFCMQRTCEACLQEFKLKDKIVKIVEDFVTSPLGRFRHVVPNLATFMGYLAALPVQDVKQVLGYSDAKNGEKALNHLWVAMVTEILRRANASMQDYRQSENQMISLLNMLLHGQHTENSKPEMTEIMQNTEENFACLCWSMSTAPNADMTLEIPEYDPTQEVTLHEVTVKQSAKVDKAVEIWAQAKCGEISNKNRASQVTEAKKTVKDWVGKMREEVGLPAEVKQKATEVAASAVGKAEEAPSCGFDSNSVADRVRKAALEKAKATFNTNQVNSSLIQVTVKVLCNLCRNAYPPLSSLPAWIGFLKHRLTHDLSWTEVKDNGEMTPPHWVSGVKDTISKVFDAMDAFRVQCQQLENSENSNGGSDSRPDNDGDGPRGEGALQAEKDEEIEGLYSDVEEEYDEEDGVVAAQSGRNRRLKQTRVVSLPQLIHALQPEGNLLELIRAMLCQAVSYPSNSQARDAVTSGEFLDLAVPANVEASLYQVEAQLQSGKDGALKKLQNQRIWDATHLCMLRTDSIWAFIGYLMLTHKERSEGFSALMKFIMECPGVKGFPLLLDKLKILLSGKYGNHVIFAKGNTWLPDEKMSKNLQKILGEDIWEQVEQFLMSNVQIHVYRESDLPNRHGHCNSNPYIPNRIRKILKMPLIEEKIQPKTSKKHRSLASKK